MGINNSPADRLWEHIVTCRRRGIRGWFEIEVMTDPLTREEALDWEDEQRDMGAPTEGYFDSGGFR